MKTSKFLRPAAGAFATGALLFSSPAQAASYYTAGHGDFGVEYTPGETEFEAHWHLGAGAVVDGSTLTDGEEYAPEDMIARLQGTRSVTNASVASALNVSTGTTVYATGNTAYPPNLGFALEEVGLPTDWANESITLTLTGFSGPGQMAMSQTITGLGTFVWFSSLGDPYTIADNSWEFGVGSHQHLDMWFTEAGDYEVTFQWDGIYTGGGTPVNVTGSGTFGFQVVPEPSTFALLVPGALALFSRRRRSQS